MTMNRHEPFEELISGSLTGDLTDAERERLDAHLDTCAACRATLAAFADQRRIVAGLRHIAPPRDLGARVRAGVERRGFRVVPWWRRPAVMFGGVGGAVAIGDHAQHVVEDGCRVLVEELGEAGLGVVTGATAHHGYLPCEGAGHSQ